VNCVAAYKIGYGLFNAGLQGQAPGVPNGSLLGSPGAPGCMNTTVAGQIATSALVPASVRNAVGLLAGLNPATPGFNGFDALARVLQLQLSLPTRPSLNGSGLDDEYNQTSNNFAIFTHNIFSITDNLKFTAGLRYTHEKKKLSADLTDTNEFCRALQTAAGIPPLASLAALQTLPCVIPSVPGGSFSDDASASENKLSGTAVLSYKPTDRLLTYASYSRGYKAGGFNLDRSALKSPILPFANTPGGAQALVGNLQFDSEINNAYELGVKYSRGPITLNVTAFRQDFRNFQLNTFNGTVFLVQNINGCDNLVGGSAADNDLSATTGSCAADDVTFGVRSQGVEVEFQLRPRRDMTLNLGMTLAKTEYRDDLVGNENGIPLDPALRVLPGNNLSNAPERVFTGSFTWTPRLGNSGLTGLFYVDARMTSDYNTGSDLFPQKAEDGYTVVNARLGIRGASQRWSLELWAQNLFDAEYAQVAFNTPFQAGTTSAPFVDPQFPGGRQIFSAFLAEPRTYGITGRFRF
jgi:outer membrane receptor protein involved in Fe transport